jgi:Flp pilus assembly protein TadD
MEQINAMIATSPDHAMFYAIRAGMEQDRKQYEAAEEDFNRAIELEPGNTDYLLNRAMLYIATNRKKEARMDLDKALQLGADANEVASMRHLLR